MSRFFARKFIVNYLDFIFINSIFAMLNMLNYKTMKKKEKRVKINLEKLTKLKPNELNQIKANELNQIKGGGFTLMRDGSFF